MNLLPKNKKKRMAKTNKGSIKDMTNKPVSHSCSQDPPLDVSPLRAIFDPEAKITDDQMPEPHLMGISTESSDSSDVEILRSPIIKNKNDAAGDNISTHAPKIIPRVEITEDADADPRF